MRRGPHLAAALLASMVGSAAAPAPDATPPRDLSDAHRLIADGCLYEAVAALKDGLELSPKDSAAQKLLATTLFRVREYADAAAYAAIVLSDAPRDAEARRVLSLSVLLSNPDLDPENAPALLERARLCSTGGLYSLSAGLYQRYLDRVAHDAAARLDYARMLGWSGRAALAVREYQTCLEAAPGNRDVRLEMARLMNQSGLHRAAAREFQRLLESTPGDAAVRLELLRALAWDGDDAAGAALLPELAAAADRLDPAALAFAADEAARLNRPGEEKILLGELDRRPEKPAGLRARLDRLAAVEEKDVPAASPRDLVEVWRARYAPLAERAAAWADAHRADLLGAAAAALLLERIGDGDRAREHLERVKAGAAVPRGGGA